MDLVNTISLIFGGCCTNALTLEHITHQHPFAGALLTFAQFLTVALASLPAQLTFTPPPDARGWRARRFPRLKPRRIPLPPYVLQVALFYVLSRLNNAAFAYAVPMPVHIIFRSGGLVVSMLLGIVLLGRRYSTLQVLSVLLVTLGVALTTLSAANPSAPSTPAKPTSNPQSYATGIALLSLALLLSGLLGIVQDRTFAAHGAAWREALFYLHALSLPLFLPSLPALSTQLRALAHGPPLALSVPLPAALLPWPADKLAAESVAVALSVRMPKVPRAYAALAANAGTQLVCVAGVNRLTARVSALSVTLVLVVRKAASLVLSVALFGDARARADRGVWAGAALVMLGTLGYTMGTSRKREEEEKNEKNEKKAKLD